MKSRHALLVALVLGGLASTRFDVADSLPLFDPLLLLGLSLILAGVLCWRHVV